jgi:pimeloyl-ACP methyl ester carboxylesterase
MSTPVVLVPGLLCSAEAFAPQAVALWPFGSVTIASTLEGATIPEIASSILECAPPRFALAGISMGGYICFEMMRQAPERISGLALVSTSASPDTPEQTNGRRALIRMARSTDFAAWAGDTFATLTHPSRRDDPELRAVNVRMALSVGIKGFERQTEAIIGRADSRPLLAAIKVPTLVLVGDTDPLTPPGPASEMALAITGAKLIIVPQCGHCSTLEQPSAVSAGLVDWISGIG